MVLASTRDGDVAVLTLQRPGRRNALNTELCRAIDAAVEQAVGAGVADGGARAIVITGEDTAFCSGADLNGVYGQEFLDALYGMLHRLAAVPVPVIAAVNGPAIGAGTQLAIACDLRVADGTAKFGVPTVRNGMAVDGWTIRRLRELAGGGMARRLMVAGELIERDEAVSCGLVDRIGELDDALTWAHELTALAPLSIAHNKLVLNGADDATVQASFESVWASADVRESQAARTEKRDPRFQGK